MGFRNLQSIEVVHRKSTAAMSAVQMPVPDVVSISMRQHIGKQCTPLVAKGEYVKVGQLIGDTDSPVSAPIHSSVSGTVKVIEDIRNTDGTYSQGIVIETDKLQVVDESIKKPEEPKDHSEFIAEIRKSGLVGLGGAAFPTHIKYNPKNLAYVDTLIVNAAECEPYITADHRLMLEEGEGILDGVEMVMKHLAIAKAVIAIEDNKKDAIDHLELLIAKRKNSNISVKVLKSRYPKGAERVLVYEITGKSLNAGVLPAELGVIVSNVATVAFVGDYFKTGMPLISKRLTVAGNGVANPKNLIAPIGTTMADLVDFCGGYTGNTNKIIMGGPLMGKAVYTDEIPIVKNNNAILVFAGTAGFLKEETACINCGRCAKACPFGLLPTKINSSYDLRDVEMLRKLDVMECIDCGSCAYVCPAGKPLGFINSFAKNLVKEASGN